MAGVRPIKDQTRLPDLSPAVATVDAETALLGAMLYDNAAIVACRDLLKGDHFFEPFFGWLYDKAVAMLAKGQIVEPVTMHDVALTWGNNYEDEFGGIAFLAALTERAPPAANAPEYARIIFDGHLRRSVLRQCQESGAQLMGDKSRPAFDIVAELRRAVEEIENAAAPEDTGIVTAHDAADLAIAEMEDLARHGRARGAMTGLRCIDRRLNGLLPGAMLVIGGRPGMMKTGLARNIMHGAAVRNPHLLFPFFGLEMGSGEMMQRELASLTQENREGIEYRAMGSGALTALDFQAIKSARQRVPSNLLLADCPSLSIDDVRRRVWALSRKGRLGAIAIDYLQLMRRPPANGRNEASVISEMTQALKQLAREAGICVVLLSQLSRAVEQRDDKRPQPWDLRESGSIEQDADAILFPFREHYYLVKAEPKKSDTDKHLAWEMACEDARYRMEVICAKQRQGPEGTDRQRCFPEYDLIEDEE